MDACLAGVLGDQSVVDTITTRQAFASICAFPRRVLINHVWPQAWLPEVSTSADAAACVRACVLAHERAQVRETHFQHLHYTQPINTRRERWPGPVAVDVVVVISGHLSWPLARTGALDDGKLHVT